MKEIPMVKKLSADEKRRQAINTTRRVAISSFLSSEDLTPDQSETMLQLVDLYGLFHSIYPKPGATARNIHRQAEAAALIQQKKTWRALGGVELQERNRRSKSAAEVARKKTKSQLYQRVRGAAVIPRFAAPADRGSETIGRRPDIEVTRFLKVGARYLKEKCEQAPDHLEECLAHVLLRAEGNLQPSKLRVGKMKDRVHTRLMEAPELDDFDYCIAIGQDPGEEWVSISLAMSQQFHVQPDLLPIVRNDGDTDLTSKRV
jgi:hypothetical protein